MPERCTCGAVLPPDALFCHKCGKPQREDLIPVEAEPAPPPPPLPQAPSPLPMGFRNGPAVRVALLAGALSIAVSMLSGQLTVLRPFLFVWLVATGFLAVFLYRRRTGQRLSALSGMRLGWLCGIFGFVFTLMMLTVFMVAMSEPSVVSTVHEQMKGHGMSETDFNQAIEAVKALRTPMGIANALLSGFLSFTVLPAFGGLIGAKFLNRD